ncbi:ArsR/SmtB family transcription factor [Jiangella asiatica]|uniref:ArsR family transcriptional regulator n=1 Tax=Jiangella asiatica TaxID=2530372 RepID=A0A4R5DSM5_9ACTN|nr:winged helix-turn-helix domain-containing protein [Jiangella asiatica]TDE14125.1 ArsR family transcriptional regulator [Jiangella asiatica]
MPDQDLKVSNPQRVRALAHPLRLKLMDLLGAEPELTATQCAELTGESVASCSFHLRMLAKYGYIQPGERRGREKPWRLVSRSRTVTPDYDDPDSVREVSAFARLVVEREADRLRRWLAAARTQPEEWVGASTITTSSFWLTAAEMQEVSDELTALSTRLAERFSGRRDDAPSRPSGARFVHILGATSVDIAGPTDAADASSGEPTP